MTSFAAAATRFRPFNTDVIRLATVHDLPLLLASQHPTFETTTALIVCVATNDDIFALCDSLRFFCPGYESLAFPAWDVEPFERLSPHLPLIHQRLRALATLSTPSHRPRFLVTTLPALIQKVLPADFWRTHTRCLAPGEVCHRESLVQDLVMLGYHRVETVRECGEFAVRGSLMDVFSPGHDRPIRIDFWGDTLESLSFFDPLMQTKREVCERLILLPAHELLVTPPYSPAFQQAALLADPDASILTEADRETVRRGMRPLGIETFSALFYPQLVSLLEVVGPATVVCDEPFAARLESCFSWLDECRQRQSERAQAAGDLYLTPVAMQALLDDQRLVTLSPFGGDAATSQSPTSGIEPVQGPWLSGDSEAWQAFVRGAHHAGRAVLWAYSSESMRQKASQFLSYQGLSAILPETGLLDSITHPSGVLLVPLLLRTSCQVSNFVCIAEQDVFGRRVEQKQSSKKRLESAFLELSQLSPGDYVVHTDHGIGRFDGLKTVTVQDQPHDCVQLTYEGGDRLFVPVENVDVIARYGSHDMTPELDRLGAASWQHRKAKVKAKIFQIADHLVKLAAERQLIAADALEPATDYEAFCDRFPYQETDDQLRAQDDIIADLASGHPMDRLICGDVGYGKTEIALRAAFLVASRGGQVVVVAPTTLLCRQHYAQFQKRFEGFSLNVAQLSRFVTAKEAARVRAAVAQGDVNVLITTHAVFAKSTHFHDLRMLIIDEEHHFGVKQKEKLKEAWPSLHVLTLTATPIPRTLQMSMVGIREMSLIATPPVDRQAVQIAVLPFDTRTLREAVLREKRRGGQVFLVSPRIEDLQDLARLVTDHVPEVRFSLAHGQMPAAELDGVMMSFSQGEVDVLISTSIVESGIDIPTANTIMIHRADLFGLAQLYQLRGRVGRSKVKGYAYLFLPTYQLKTTAIRRLEAMQSLDGLGAGFTLASHDMDIRGAGNLVGAEQSGYIREVGVELYQHMLEAAVTALKQGQKTEITPQGQSPQIALSMPVSIPEEYIPDAGIRLGLYRRGAALKTPEELASFQAELQDRFGHLPQEVQNLLILLELKMLCLSLGVAKLDVGDRGMTLTFARPPHLSALVAFMQDQKGTVKLRPDEKLVVLRAWSSMAEPCSEIKTILRTMVARGIAGPARHDAS